MKVITSGLVKTIAGHQMRNPIANMWKAVILIGGPDKGMQL